MLKLLPLILILTTYAHAITLKQMKQEQRIAIVIGNEEYDDSPVESATKDAHKMKVFLEANGFYVYYGENLDKKNTIRLLRKFNKALRDNAIALFYYKGHILQSKKENYLIPIDSGILAEKMLKRKSVSFKSVLRGLDHVNSRLNILILDSAKGDTFSNFAPKAKGLCSISTSDAYTFFFATKTGVIVDNDRFTHNFIQSAKTKGHDLLDIKNDLYASAYLHKHQTPLVYTSKATSFFFVLPDRLISKDEKAFKKIPIDSSKKQLEDFIMRYPNSSFIPESKQRLKILEEKDIAQRRAAFEAAALKATQKQKALLEANETASTNELLTP